MESHPLSEPAFELRRSIIEMSSQREGAHLGGSLSVADVLCVLFHKSLRLFPDKPDHPDRDVFLVEGHRQLRRGLEARAVVREVYAAPELYLGPSDDELVARAEQRGTRVIVLGERAFRSISGWTRPDGLLAVVE